MKTIYKYQIPYRREFTLELFERFKFLKADTIQNIPFIWCEVDTENKLKKFNFKLYRTGEEMNPEQIENHLGSFYQGTNVFEWHLYQVVPAEGTMHRIKYIDEALKKVDQSLDQFLQDNVLPG